MFQYLLVLFILLIFDSGPTESKTILEQNPIVSTINGKVRGSVLRTRYDEEFYAFRGIRYGKPPINHLRFQAPEPIGNWDEIFDATEDGPACIQISNFIQSEDCLRLNIYSKSLPGISTNSIKKRVLFQIHGGGFYNGSALTNDLGGPVYLMEHDIVFVTINYRLSGLGFLSLNISKAPGNAGFKDQVLALKWVKKNIDRFGGDPNEISLIGDSAGGYAVLLHMVSPMSQNLFKRVISMSPVVFQHRTKSNLIELSTELAIDAGCTSSLDPEQIYYCLSSTDSVRFLGLLPDESTLANKRLKWDAVAEPDFGQERFLFEDPYESFKNGRFAKVPLLIGQNNQECFWDAYNFVNNETIVKIFPDQFDDILPICFRCEKSSEYAKKVGPEILNSYNLSLLLEPRDFSKLGEVFSDGMIGYPVQRVIDFMHNFVDVFYYELSFQQKESVFLLDGEPYGVSHGDEDKYVFSHSRIINPNDPENEIVKRMTRMWVQFVLTGTPDIVGDLNIKDFFWKPYTFEDHYYLEFGDELVLNKNLYRDRLNVWYKYFK